MQHGYFEISYQQQQQNCLDRSSEFLKGSLDNKNLLSTTCYMLHIIRNLNIYILRNNDERGVTEVNDTLVRGKEVIYYFCDNSINIQRILVIIEPNQRKLNDDRD
jgi:hypothetical protein